MKGIEAAISDGGSILAIPLGQSYPDDPERREAAESSGARYRLALDRLGVIALAAAGNAGRGSEVNFPVRLDNIVAVGGTSADYE